MSLHKQLGINDQVGISQKRLYLFSNNKVREHLLHTHQLIMNRMLQLGCTLHNCNWILDAEEFTTLNSKDLMETEGLQHG